MVLDAVRLAKERPTGRGGGTGAEADVASASGFDWCTTDEPIKMLDEGGVPGEAEEGSTRELLFDDVFAGVVGVREVPIVVEEGGVDFVEGAEGVNDPEEEPKRGEVECWYSRSKASFQCRISSHHIVSAEFSVCNW